MAVTCRQSWWLKAGQRASTKSQRSREVVGKLSPLDHLDKNTCMYYCNLKITSTLCCVLFIDNVLYRMSLNTSRKPREGRRNLSRHPHQGKISLSTIRTQTAGIQYSKDPGGHRETQTTRWLRYSRKKKNSQMLSIRPHR